MKKALELIDLFSDTKEDQALDLWFADRYVIEFRLAAALAACGKKEEAYDALESAVAIVEKASALPEGAVLGYRCPTLDRITGKVTTGYSKRTGEMYKHISLYDGVEKLDRGFSAFLANDLHFLETRKGWEWFDSIRDEDRYKALAERFRKAVC